jgi:hypothetical protein
MLQAQTRWKLWSLSATAALGILSIADPAEAIGASDADKVYVSAQCGNSFKNQIPSTEMQPNSVGEYPFSNRLSKNHVLPKHTTSH